MGRPRGSSSARRTQRTGVAIHPVIDLHHRTAQVPQPREDAVARRSSKHVTNPTPGLHLDVLRTPKNSSAMTVPLDVTHFQRMRTFRQLRERRRPAFQRSLVLTVTESARTRTLAAQRRVDRRPQSARPGRYAPKGQRKSAFDHQRIPPSETPRWKDRCDIKYTIRLGIVAIIDAANSGPHWVVCSPMKKLSAIGSVSMRWLVDQCQGDDELLPGKVECEHRYHGQSRHRQWRNQPSQHA